MPRPKTYTDAARPVLVSAAADVMAHEGVDAVSTRRIAAAAGVSTTAIYTLFGSRDALVAAVVTEAVESFLTAQRDAVTGADAVADLRRLGLSYRAWAVRHRSLYEVMFAGRVPPQLLEDSGRAMVPLREVLARLDLAGLLVGGDPDAAALAIWGAVHGVVSLELALWPDQDSQASEAQYGIALAAVERAWVRGAGPETMTR